MLTLLDFQMVFVLMCSFLGYGMLKLTSVSGLGMFASNEDEVRLKAIQTILSARKESHSHSSTKVRQFVVPEINIEANNFYDMIDFSDEVYEPPLLTRFKNNEIEELDSRPLKLLHPCHNQALERHVKLVTTEVSYHYQHGMSQHFQDEIV